MLNSGPARLAAFAVLAVALPLISVQTGPSKLTFEDITARSGVSFLHRSSAGSQKYLPESMSGGVAVFDYDGDGWLDIFLLNGAALSDPMKLGQKPDKTAPAFWNRLYRNNHDGTFTDVTEKAGVRGSDYSMGVATGDYDNDGHTDVYVTGLNGNTLFHNNGDGTFSDVTAAAGVGSEGWSAGALFVDYDRDGLLDLVVSRYLKWDFSMNVYCGERKPGLRAYCHPDQFQAISHVLYHNDGHGRFRDVSQQSGLAVHPGKGLGIAMNDYDRDGWPDIFIANDSMPQQLFHNKHNGTFDEVAVNLGAAFDSDGRAFAGMGADFADYDNDGWPDLFANGLATQRYSLFHNLQGSFDYVSDSSGVGAASMLHSGWGAKFTDFDNDGWKDLFVGQSHVMDNIQATQPHLRYLEPPLLMRNVQGKFVDVSTQTGSAMQNAIAARGVAFGDLNHDGRIDVVINCTDRRAIVLQNQSAGDNHWLLVNTIGTESNRDGIGTQIRLVAEAAGEQFSVVTSGGSYLSSNDKRVHFGLGKNKMVKLLELRWPSGKVQRLENFTADRVLTVKEP